MARYLVVQEFDVDVFKDQACEVYGINPDDLPFFIWSTTPWQVHNIDPSMVYAFTWDEIPFEQGVKAKEEGLPVILQDSYAFLATPRNLSFVSEIQDVDRKVLSRERHLGYFAPQSLGDAESALG